MDRILDRSCQIHDTPEKPANHTNRDCWVFKQAGKLIAENNNKGCIAMTRKRPDRRTIEDRRVSPHKCGR